MQTHFVRRPSRPAHLRANSSVVGSPIESLVLEAVPEDFLVTADAVFDRVVSRARKEGDTPPVRRFLDNLLAKLAREGWIYEVHPQRVKKMLEAIQ